MISLKNEYAVETTAVNASELEDIFTTTVEDAIGYCRRLCKDLAELIRMDTKLGKTVEENKKILSRELLEVWETYMIPYRLHGITSFEIHKIKDKKFYRKPVSKEETRLFEIYEKQVEEDCVERVGKSKYAAEVVNRAKNYYILLNFDVPEDIIRNERAMLQKAIVLHMIERSVKEPETEE